MKKTKRKSVIPSAKQLQQRAWRLRKGQISSIRRQLWHVSTKLPGHAYAIAKLCDSLNDSNNANARRYGINI